MKFINNAKNNLPLLFRFFRHSRENGNPESANNTLDSRFHGNDKGDINTCKSSVFRNLPPTTYHLPPNRAFTLIETLVAISILMIAVASPLTIAQKGLASAIYAKDQIIASYLAQDAIEYIINASGKNVADGNGWLNGITGNGKCDTGCKISTDIDFTSTGAIENCGGACPVLKYDKSSHIYSHTLVDDSPFTRTVKVVESPTNEALITVTMSWKDKGADRSLDFYTRVFNWR